MEPQWTHMMAYTTWTMAPTTWQESGVRFGKGTFLSQKILEGNKLEFTAALVGHLRNKVEFRTLLAYFCL